MSATEIEGGSDVKFLEALYIWCLTLAGVGIYQVQKVGDFPNDADLSYSPERVGELLGQADDVVLAHGHHLHRCRVLVVVDVAAGVVGDELLGVVGLDRYHRGQELRQLPGLPLGSEEEIEAL